MQVRTDVPLAPWPQEVVVRSIRRDQVRAWRKPLNRKVILQRYRLTEDHAADICERYWRAEEDVTRIGADYRLTPAGVRYVASALFAIEQPRPQRPGRHLRQASPQPERPRRPRPMYSYRNSSRRAAR